MESISALKALAKKWREDAVVYERDALEPLARVTNRHADELEKWLRTAGDALLGLTDAARATGYSPDHLGRLVRSGKLPNYGRAGCPKVRLSDLPRKIQRLARDHDSSYDVDADARALQAAGKAPK